MIFHQFDLDSLLMEDGVNAALTAGASPARSACSWFADMQRAIDNPTQPDMPLFLACACKLIYDIGGEKRQQSHPENEQIVGVYCHFQRCRANFELANNAMRSLAYAERQNKAFERQQSANASQISFDNAMELPPDFFKSLYELKKACISWNTDTENTCVYGYKKLWEKCHNQPIALAILPTLFTVAVIDGSSKQNTFAYMKYKNLKLSSEHRMEVVSLYKNVKKLLEHSFRGSAMEYVPVFHWDEIWDRFCQHQQLTERQAAIVRKYMKGVYLRSYSLTMQDQLEIEAYADKVKALAKLCNMNFCVMYQLPNSRTRRSTRNPKLSKALRLLEQGELLPPVLDHDMDDIFWRYFDGLCDLIPYDILSDFAFLRYFGFSIDSGAYDLLGISDMKSAVSFATAECSSSILKAYKLDHSIAVFQSDNPNNRYAESILAARNQYYAIQRNYIAKAGKFSYHIARKFKESDYRTFIQNPDHFSALGFHKYLNSFCNLHSIHFKQEPTSEEWYIWEESAFSTILELLRSYLMENYMSSVTESIIKVLYGK